MDYLHWIFSSLAKKPNAREPSPPPSPSPSPLALGFASFFSFYVEFFKVEQLELFNFLRKMFNFLQS
jgi:hypothetical protein